MTSLSWKTEPFYNGVNSQMKELNHFCFYEMTPLRRDAKNKNSRVDSIESVPNR